MVVQAEQDRVKHLLSEALPMLCKSGLSFSSEFCIEALIGITLDKNDVFLVSIKETITPDNINGDSQEKSTDVSITRVDADDTGSVLTPRSSRKRRHSKNSRTSDSESDNEVNDVQIKREKLTSMDHDDDSENAFDTSSSSQINYTTSDAQGTGPVFVKQEPFVTDSINVEQAVGNFNVSGLSGFSEHVGEADLENQTIVRPMQSLSHDETVLGLGRSAGITPIKHTAEDTNQEKEPMTTSALTNLQFYLTRKSAANPDDHSINCYIQKMDDRKFVCTLCCSMFKEGGKVRRHIKMVHLKERKHECIHCGKTFASKQMCMKHQNNSCLKKKDDIT